MFGLSTKNKRRIQFDELARLIENIRITKIKSCSGLFCNYFDLTDRDLNFNEIIELITQSLGLRPNACSLFSSGQYVETELNGKKEYLINLYFREGYRRIKIFGVNK